MSIVRAVVLGVVATGVLAYVLAGAVALVIAGSGGDLRLATGPLLWLEVDQAPGGAAVTLGPGLVLLALLGGAINGLAGLLVGRRTGHDGNRVP